MDTSDLTKQSHRVLDTMIMSGGVIRESRLPINELLRFRLTNKNLIRAIDEMETGEMVYAITPEGVEEYERNAHRMGN